MSSFLPSPLLPFLLTFSCALPRSLPPLLVPFTFPCSLCPLCRSRFNCQIGVMRLADASSLPSFSLPISLILSVSAAHYIQQPQTQLGSLKKRPTVPYSLKSSCKHTCLAVNRGSALPPAFSRLLCFLLCSVKDIATPTYCTVQYHMFSRSLFVWSS